MNKKEDIDRKLTKQEFEDLGAWLRWIIKQ